MNEASESKNPLDLSGLDFGPAWAKNDKPKKKTYYSRDENSLSKGRKGGRPHSERGDRERSAPGGGKRKFSNNRRDDRYERPRPERETLPENVKASIMPVEEGIDNLVKQISATGRTYSVFDLARVVLKSRERYNICFSVAADADMVIYQSLSDQATFFKEEEALNHFAASEKFNELYKTVEVETEAPKGNFPSIACCGFTNEPIAPPNYHGYQALVSERHAAGFSNMSLDKYKSRIKSERDEEKVAQWMESMKMQKKYQLTSDPSQEFETKADAITHFKANGFVAEYPVLKKAFVKSDVDFKTISSGLASGLLEVISEQNRYPGELSSFLCRQLSGRQLAVYKWQNKLHAGPSRPHAIPEDTKLADRPQAILNWVKENSGKGIDELWKSTLEADVTEEVKTLWFHDLHWMLNQGYLVLLENGRLYLSSDAKKKPQQAGKKKAKPQADTRGAKTAKKAATPKEEKKSVEKPEKTTPKQEVVEEEKPRTSPEA